MLQPFSELSCQLGNIVAYWKPLELKVYEITKARDIFCNLLQNTIPLVCLVKKKNKFIAKKARREERIRTMEEDEYNY